MVNRIRRRLRRHVVELTPATHREVADLRLALDALALELRDLNATTTNGYRATSDAIRAELDHAVSDLTVRHEAFDQYVRQWVPESIDALRDHLQVHAVEAVDSATDSMRTRLRRLERSSAAVPHAGAAAETGEPEGPIVRTPAKSAPAVSDLGLSYSAFEDELRGSPDHVKALSAVHVTTISGFGAEGLPVLDVGCGRGELIELLRDAGVPARGIDLNAVSVAECVDQGLDVVVGDAVMYLNSLPPGSLRAVCGLHLVEHMTDADRTQLFLAAHRAIAPGGGLLMETPNPENLRVGSTTFWLDPTHLRPVPPQLLEFQVAQAGFEDVTVQRLHPSDDALAVPDDADPLAKQLAGLVNRLVAGPMDYAVVGRRADEST